MNKIISKLKEFFDDVFYPNSNLLKMNHYPPMPKMKVQYKRFKEYKSMEELKRCPFCNATAEIFSEYKYYCVKCMICGANGPYRSSEEAAIKSWNGRANNG